MAFRVTSSGFFFSIPVTCLYSHTSIKNHTKPNTYPPSLPHGASWLVIFWRLRGDRVRWNKKICWSYFKQHQPDTWLYQHPIHMTVSMCCLPRRGEDKELATRSHCGSYPPREIVCLRWTKGGQSQRVVSDRVLKSGCELYRLLKCLLEVLKTWPDCLPTFCQLSKCAESSGHPQVEER